MTWERGRQLATMSDGTTTWTNTYNADGLRTQRTDGTTTYTYTYDNAGRLTGVQRNDLQMWIFYDENGPTTLKYGSGTFHYVLNLQGDVVALIGGDGRTLVEYTYDAWGNVIDIDGEYAYNLGEHNPIRYRGYIYDAETGLYYVSSRYYDPEIGRWINADDTVYLGADGTLLSNNLFAYCSNNPVNKIDKTGNLGLAIGLFIGASAVIGGFAGAFTAACTGSNVLEGALEGAALGAVAATATIVAPLLLPTTASAAVTVGVTFVAAGAGGMVVDYTTQRISHELSENSNEEFVLNKGRLIKTGFTTGIAGVVPTYGNPGSSVLNAGGSLVMGFDASFFNAAAEIAITHFLK